MKRFIQSFGKFTGVVSGVAVCVLWNIAMWFPSPELPLSGVSFAVALLMAMLGIIVAIASIKGHAITLIVLFVASFFPIGLYLLGVPTWIRVIGILNFGYLIAGLIAWAMPYTEVKPASQHE